jgi:hypothetical protein
MNTPLCVCLSMRSSYQPPCRSAHPACWRSQGTVWCSRCWLSLWTRPAFVNSHHICASPLNPHAGRHSLLAGNFKAQAGAVVHGVSTWTCPSPVNDHHKHILPSLICPARRSTHSAGWRPQGMGWRSRRWFWQMKHTHHTSTPITHTQCLPITPPPRRSAHSAGWQPQVKGRRSR